MSDLCLLAASLLTQRQMAQQPLPSSSPTSEAASIHIATKTCPTATPAATIASTETHHPEFSSLKPPHPLASDAVVDVNPQAIPSVRIFRPTSSPVSGTNEGPGTAASEMPATSVPVTSAPADTRPVAVSAPDRLNLPPVPLIPVPNSVALRTPRPASGSQLYQQRWAALRSGRNYTRLPANSFWESWVDATYQPTYEQWVGLLGQEAGAMARGQGANRLTVLLGDSLYLWYPPEQLPGDRFWLNQGISGDTTAGILRRLTAFVNTRPDTIHLMAGINDLRRGTPDSEVLDNLRQIMRRLHQTHPQARIFVHSILPTRLAAIPSDRINRINQNLALIAQEEQVEYLDLISYFADAQGNLRRDLTTDGLHLNPRGYAVWQWAMRSHHLA